MACENKVRAIRCPVWATVKEVISVCEGTALADLDIDDLQSCITAALGNVSNLAVGRGPDCTAYRKIGQLLVVASVRFGQP